MTRSSWQWFWSILTVEAGILCLFFVFAAAGSEKALQGAQPLMAGQAVPLFYVLLAQQLARIAAVFWGTVAVCAGTAWAACALALAERKRLKVPGMQYVPTEWSFREGKGVDVDLRA